MKVKITLMTGDVFHRFIPLSTSLTDFTSDPLVVSVEIISVEYR